MAGADGSGSCSSVLAVAVSVLCVIMLLYVYDNYYHLFANETPLALLLPLLPLAMKKNLAAPPPTSG